jgi:hypothetical protein
MTDPLVITAVASAVICALAIPLGALMAATRRGAHNPRSPAGSTTACSNSRASDISVPGQTRGRRADFLTR